MAFGKQGACGDRELLTYVLTFVLEESLQNFVFLFSHSCLSLGVKNAVKAKMLNIIFMYQICKPHGMLIYKNHKTMKN